MRRAGRWLLGVGLVLNGLANSVLPLRGIDRAGPGAWMPFWTAISAVAILGFVVAGLSVLGVRPLRRTAVASSIGAGVCSLIGLWRLGDADLAVGMLLAIGLPAATIAWCAPQQRVEQPPARSPWRASGQAAGVLLLAWTAINVVSWPWYRAWGTSRQDWLIELPGDRSPRTPAFELMHAVTIDAPPKAVWPWLVQLGQDRAGFYSYDRLERLMGVDIHNVREIRPEWQSRMPGDRVHATQEGYLGGLFGVRPGWDVTIVEPNRALVLQYWGAFVLMPIENGRTRFLVRSTISNERIPAWAAAINLLAFEPIHFLMEQRMLRTIKSLAEDHRTALAVRRD